MIKLLKLKIKIKMENYICDILAFVTGAIMAYCVGKKKRQIKKPLRYIYLIIALFMMILAIIAMIVGKYDNICAILFGIVFFTFTYCDKNKPSPGFSIEYTNHLDGYVAGIVAIAYGIIKCFS